ncbi:MAG: TRAP transporter large permease [Burkholderiaceae bacterium]|nr:TRAP transporter large permease [Burkholderiaceae bacterium]
MIIGLLLFVGLLALGAPVFLAVTASGLFLALAVVDLPLSTLAQQFYVSIDVFVLMAVPYFILSGNILLNCGPSRYLFRFLETLVGHLPGGMAAAAVLACMIFGALSGSGIATVVAIGSIAIPEMLRLGYSKSNSMGLITCSGTLGQMIPPSIYMILFATLVQGDVSVYFLSGVIPGLFIGLLLLVAAVFVAWRGGMRTEPRASWGARGLAFKEAIPVLLMPLIVLGGIYGGIFTPTEAAAVSIVYSLLISQFVYRTLTRENFAKSVRDAMIGTAVIFIILGGAMLLAATLTHLRLPHMLMTAVTEIGLTPTMLLLAIVLLFFALGTVMDPVPIMYITVPILLPVLIAAQIDLVHFNVITVAAMMAAQVTPPFGMALFAMAGIFREPVGMVVRGALPYLAVLMFGTLVIIFFPGLSLFLPNLMAGR